MKVALTLVLAVCLGVSGCAKPLPAADLPALTMPRGQVIPALTKAGFACHLVEGDQPFYACRDVGMSGEPLTAFISVDITNGIDASSADTCFDGETPTLDKYPGLAYPVLLAQGFEAAWIPSNDQMGNASATAEVLKQAEGPMKRIGDVVGLQPTTIAAACGIKIPSSAAK